MSSYRFEEHPGPSKKDILFSTLVDFYTVPKNLEMMKNVIEGKTVLSLRLLDWLVTNYSKRFPYVTKYVTNCTSYIAITRTSSKPILRNYLTHFVGGRGFTQNL